MGSDHARECEELVTRLTKSLSNIYEGVQKLGDSVVPKVGTIADNPAFRAQRYNFRDPNDFTSEMTSQSGSQMNAPSRKAC